ncbi:MAG TPA: RnfABCDGE type electron transport complex subunit D [Desulfobacteraceae bacterium]|nr:RnfABCDGE type electron transport complex subunit D [Desulfobacteraceae bacterium]
MFKDKYFVGKHAPFLHNGSSIGARNWNAVLAALPAVIFGILQYGAPALGVTALSVSSAMIWETIMNRLSRRPPALTNGSAALIGLLLAMLLPATAPWWIVVLGTFIAIVIGKEIYGGTGCNPFNPVLVAMAVLMLSWKGILDFDKALVYFDMEFTMLTPLAAMKNFGAAGAEGYALTDMLLGRQAGGIGSTFGIGLLAGGIYLIAKGIVRWEIPVSFLAGAFVTALIFKAAAPDTYGPPLLHLVTGYSLIAAFFLAPEDSSSPVNLVPMIIYGAGAGFLTILIRNIGGFVDGSVFAILMMNVANPLIDKIRPRALGKGIKHA